MVRKLLSSIHPSLVKGEKIGLYRHQGFARVIQLHNRKASSLSTAEHQLGPKTFIFSFHLGLTTTRCEMVNNRSGQSTAKSKMAPRPDVILQNVLKNATDGKFSNLTLFQNGSCFYAELPRKQQEEALPNLVKSLWAQWGIWCNKNLSMRYQRHHAVHSYYDMYLVPHK